MKNLPFDSITVPLKNSNLIEASAGTGKTYSIALLTLRLLLEKRIPIQEILMVTFTKAAVAELEMRIRLFVRLAHQVSLEEEIEDASIIQIVQKSVKAIGKKETEQLLKTAVLFLDETSVLTIHSFCQRTLKEFAFETKQIFGAEAMEEGAFNELRDDQINKFWRRHVVVMEKELLTHLTADALSRDTLIAIIKNELGGKKLLVIESFEPDFLSKKNQKKILTEILVQENIILDARKQAVNYIQQHNGELRSAVEASTHARKKFSELFENPEAMLDLILGLLDKQYVQKIFREVIALLEPLEAAQNEKERIVTIYTNKIYQLAIQIISTEVHSRKEKNSLLTFDDMIDQLHEAIVSSTNEKLIAAIRTNYKAVFIDEFQDTDKKQYEIFSALFRSETILFYIGDPKQSIYAWRKADLKTYLKARTEVDHCYEMNINYRSSEGNIRAQNGFFKPAADFNTFHFNSADEEIDYHPVNPPSENHSGELLFENKTTTPITIFENANNSKVFETVTATVISLLAGDKYLITKNGISRKVKPSDIGILMRSNKKGIIIKEKLAAHRIPAITINEKKLSQTQEARELSYVLRAAIEITAANINKALLTGITGFRISELQRLDEDKVLLQFKSYQLTLEKEGVYVMLMKFMADYQVKARLLSARVINGERRLSNTLQLLEVLHKKQSRSHYSAVELVNWLQKAIEGDNIEGDEFEQRMESDDEAVKIVTIHKSKGLEYNIVIAPFLDLKTEVNDMSGFRDPDSGDYLFAPKNLLNEDQTNLILEQQEQENRRLIYVAITRAKFKCFINSNSFFSKSGLKLFLSAINAAKPDGIEFADAPELPEGFIYDAEKTLYPVVYKKADGFTLSQLHWRRLSYTYLNPEHEYIPKLYSGAPSDSYGDYIFRKLRKGAFTGNLLHYIFEFINFSDSKFWEKVISNALIRLSPEGKPEHETNLKIMLEHVTKTTLPCGEEQFTLAELKQDSRLSEFEFDFTVAPMQPAQINALSTPAIPFEVKSTEQLEGIMNGKMDLFFEKNGKYYILDWKSNFLGDTLEDYSMGKVSEAMSENNYHLQYHIYTAAVCKYLELKLPDFSYEKHFGGVIYLFVRGVRKESNTGIFFHLPNADTIGKLRQCFDAQEN